MNNTTTNNTTTNNTVSTLEYFHMNDTYTFVAPSRYHSPEDNARIRAAMEREFQETGGEYDTDFSDDDELFYEDEETYTEGETKEN